MMKQIYFISQDEVCILECADCISRGGVWLDAAQNKLRSASSERFEA